MSKKEAFLEVNLKTSDRREIFYSLEDIENWLKAEEDFWRWPEDFNRQAGPNRGASPSIGTIESALNEIRNCFKNLKKGGTPAESQQQLNVLKSKIEESYDPQRKKLLHSATDRAQFVHGLIADGQPLAAAYVVGFFMGAPVNPGDPHSFAGAVRGVLFDLGVERSCEAEKAALGQLRQEWNEERLRAQKTNEDNAKTAEDWKAGTKNDRTKQLNEFSEFMRGIQTEIDDYKKLVKEEIALKEARRLGIPTVALIDTNCDPEQVDYPIPGNDDAIRAVKLFCDLVADAIQSGRNEFLNLYPEALKAGEERWVEKTAEAPSVEMGAAEAKSEIETDGAAVPEPEKEVVETAEELAARFEREKLESEIKSKTKRPVRAKEPKKIK